MYYTFIDLGLPVGGDTVSGCLAHYFPSVNYCATTAASLFLGGVIGRMVASQQKATIEGNIGPYTSEKM